MILGIIFLIISFVLFIMLCYVISSISNMLDANFFSCFFEEIFKNLNIGFFFFIICIFTFLGIFFIVKAKMKKKRLKKIEEENIKEKQNLKNQIKVLQDKQKQDKYCAYCGALIEDNHCTGCGAKNLK